MFTCDVERFFDIAKGLPPNRGGAAEEFSEPDKHRLRCYRETRVLRATMQTAPVWSWAAGRIVPTDPTGANSTACEPVLDHLTMADGDTRRLSVS